MPGNMLKSNMVSIIFFVLSGEVTLLQQKPDPWYQNVEGEIQKFQTWAILFMSNISLIILYFKKSFRYVVLYI